jgi:hypothetical protein
MTVKDADLVEIALQGLKKANDFGVRSLEGHKVARVLWETPMTVIFRDEQEHCWRYLQVWGQAWPVIVVGPQDPEDSQKPPTGYIHE